MSCLNFKDFETEEFDKDFDEGTAQCEDCEKQQVHIYQVDSHSYWKLDSGQVPLQSHIFKQNKENCLA